MNSFFSPFKLKFKTHFSLKVRWGILRIKEFDVLNVICLNLAFFTDFDGVKPTDLGLRPDGTLRTCPVQFHTCISSSNLPTDTEHYAPPLKWSRSKSPEQVILTGNLSPKSEIYPKKWTLGVR